MPITPYSKKRKYEDESTSEDSIDSEHDDESTSKNSTSSEHESEDDDAETSSEVDSADEYYNHPDYAAYAAEREEESDPDNPDPYPDEEEYTAEDILNWIDEKPVVDEEGEIIEHTDYPPLDDDEMQHIVEHTDPSELHSVKETLLKRNLDEDTEGGYSETLKLIAAHDSDFEVEDTDLLNKNLAKAVEAEDDDDVEFFQNKGADNTAGIQAAISADSYSMLETLEADVEGDYVESAAMGKHLDALAYFLKEDFSASYEIALKIAIDQKNNKMIIEIFEHAELRHFYDIIKPFIKNKNDELIRLLFEVCLEKFSLKDLWEEIQSTTIEQDILEAFIRYALQLMSSVNDENDEFEELQKHFVEVKDKLAKGLYSPYPIGNFKGDARLAEKRLTLYNDTRLDTINKVAATCVGYPLSTCYRFFPRRSAYQPIAMSLSEKYFRGGGHPLKQVFSSKDEKNTERAGNIKYKKGGLGNIADGPVRDTVSRFPFSEALPPHYQAGDLYDYFLRLKHDTSLSVANQCKHLTTIKVTSYHEYPCVMVFLCNLPKPTDFGQTAWTDAEKEAWTELMISFFVGLVNYKSQKVGLLIELVRRSSFGFLTPTIAPCTQSFRINVGAIPADYSAILVECLEILNNTLNVLENKAKHAANLMLQLPQTGCFSQSKKQEYKAYKGSYLAAKDILHLLWLGITKKEDEKTKRVQTGAVKITANLPVARIQLSMCVYNELIQSDAKIANEYCYANAFLNGIRWSFSQCQIKGNKLTYVQAENAIALKKFKPPIYKIVDGNFFDEVGSQAQLIMERCKVLEEKMSVGVAFALSAQELNRFRKIIAERDVKHFYLYLESLNEILFANSISLNASPEDAEASDSDVDDEIDEKSISPRSNIYGRKVIVNHGMMAIMQSLMVGAEHAQLPTVTKKKYDLTRVYFNGAYYEIEKDFPKLKKDLKLKGINLIKTKQLEDARILINDINACVTTGKKIDEIDVAKYPNIKIWIIDTTSATLFRQHEWVEKFRCAEKATILFLASSALKHEQLGADKMPFGTIRVFAKDKKTLNQITTTLKLRAELSSELANNYRRLMKVLGAIPNNKKIVKYQKDDKLPETKQSTCVTTSTRATDAQLTVSPTTNASATKNSPVPLELRVPNAYSLTGYMTSFGKSSSEAISSINTHNNNAATASQNTVPPPSTAATAKK